MEKLEIIKGKVTSLIPKEKNYLVFLDKKGEDGKSLMLSGWLTKDTKQIPEGLEKGKFYAFSCERNPPFINIKSFTLVSQDGEQPSITEENIGEIQPIKSKSIEYSPTPEVFGGKTTSAESKYVLNDLRTRSILVGQAANLAQNHILHYNSIEGLPGDAWIEEFKVKSRKYFNALVSLQEELL